MPNTKSAVKALRQSKVRAARNLSQKDAFRNAFKGFKKLVIAGKTSDAAQALAGVYQKFDKAAKAGVIKKNKASRLKAKAARLLAAK